MINQTLINIDWQHTFKLCMEFVSHSLVNISNVTNIDYLVIG